MDSPTNRRVRHPSVSLPPIGVFWDIENCCVPRGRSALAIVQCIRQKLFTGHHEAEFMCVCDINKQRKDIIQELNDAQVTVVHINAFSKNAADDKLRQSIRRFGNTHSPPATVVLISGDVNFAADLSDLQHRCRFHVILVHNIHVKEALLTFADEHYLWDCLVGDVPLRSPQKTPKVSSVSPDLLITNLPENVPMSQIRGRLKKLCDNCGGKVKSVNKGNVIVKFMCVEDAERARKRIDGEDVHGSKIKVSMIGDENQNVKKDAKVDGAASADAVKKPRAIRAQVEPKTSTSPKMTSSPKTNGLKPVQVEHEDDRGKRFNTRTYLLLQQQLFQEEQQNLLNYDKNYSNCYDRPQSMPPAYAYPNLDHSFHGFSMPSKYYRNGGGYNINYRSNPDLNNLGTSPRSSPSFGRSTSPYKHNLGYRNDTYFQPIPGRRSTSPRPVISPVFQYGNGPGSVHNLSMCSSSSGNYPPDSCELIVSNLDYNISAREWKKILWTTFEQQVSVLNVSIQTQSDNTNIALIKVPSLDEARYAISQYHRKKIGYKRIHVALASGDNRSGNNLRSEVIALLNDVPGNTLPLFKFVELFEKRYHRSISVSELFKLKDVVEIQDQDGPGRRVKLVPGARVSPALSSASDMEVQEIFETPVCPIHCAETSFVDYLDSVQLPNVILSLRSFAAQVHTLLQTHDGIMPLVSFPICYESEFSPLPSVVDGGVPLEHLVSCVPGIQIKLSKSGIKKVQWAENKPPAEIEFGNFCATPVMGQQLSQFSREVVDLLKLSPHCQMPFTKFIPAYHHHFGRQCRVADYGYTKLMELFEAIPHVLQVIGIGQRVMLTLTHRVQVKRFTSDLLRVLKAMPNKQVTYSELPEIYMRSTDRPFDITDYGVCYLEDMLIELPETTVMVLPLGEEMVIAVPRRDQTPEEIEKTQEFTLEVVDLLKHSPHAKMPFNKFIPSYHHHFGKQCKVADYGFSKLMELFEAIPEVIKVIDEQEKFICLTESELLKVFAEQTLNLLKAFPAGSVPLNEFKTKFIQYHGHPVKEEEFGCGSLTELLSKISHVVKVVGNGDQDMVSVLHHVKMSQPSCRVLLLLMDNTRGGMSRKEVQDNYKATFSTGLDIDYVLKELEYYIEVNGSGEQQTIQLNPLQMFAREVKQLLRNNQGKIALTQFESVYMSHYGVQLKPVRYGFSNVVALLQAIPHVATIRGKGYRKTVLQSQDFVGKLSHYVPPIPNHYQPAAEGRKSNSPSNDSGITDDEEKELIHLAHSRIPSPIDLLAGRVPSAIPSPELAPNPIMPQQDLIHFDGAIKSYSMEPGRPIEELIGSLSHNEKAGQMTPLCMTPVSEMLQFAAQYLPTPLPDVSQEQQALQMQIEQLHLQQNSVQNHDAMQQHLQILPQETAPETGMQINVGADTPVLQMYYPITEQSLQLHNLQLQEQLNSMVESQNQLLDLLQQTGKTEISEVQLQQNQLMSGLLSNDSTVKENIQQSVNDKILIENTHSLPASADATVVVEKEGQDDKEGQGQTDKEGLGVSPSKTTPRKCRIAAKFKVPIEPPREN